MTSCGRSEVRRLVFGGAVIALHVACGGTAEPQGEKEGATNSEGARMALACPGAVEPPSAGYVSNQECRSDADCRGSYRKCGFVDASMMCGAPSPGCGNGCADGEVCKAGLCGGGCIPKCTPTSCAAGTTCGTSGLCEPIPCTEAGGACPKNQRCNPANIASGFSGCAPLSCAADSDCDCGVCFQKQCVDRIPTCYRNPS